MAVRSNAEYRKKSYIQVIARLIGSELIGISFALFYVVAKEPLGALANVVFGISAPGCLICIFADHCLKLGGKMKGNVTLHGEEPQPRFGLLLGILASIPYFITYCLLIASKLGAIENMTGIFKLINAPFLPLIDIFAPGATPSPEIPWGGLIVIGLLPITLIAACHIAYKVSYDDIDVAKKVLYKE